MGLASDGFAPSFLYMVCEGPNVSTASPFRASGDISETLQHQMLRKCFHDMDSCELVAIHIAFIVKEMKSHAYPYTFQTINAQPHSFPALHMPVLYT